MRPATSPTRGDGLRGGTGAPARSMGVLLSTSAGTLTAEVLSSPEVGRRCGVSSGRLGLREGNAL